jgi:hypothetical protein
MRRASLDRARTLRVWRAHKRIIHNDLATDCLCDDQPGRFRKGQRIGGCDRPGCWCKIHKLIHKPTLPEYRAALALYEWATELGINRPRPRKP